jgi:hypothetical protein
LEFEEQVRVSFCYEALVPEAPDKLLALAHISGTEVPLIVDEVIHQIIVFRSNQVAPYIP